jgi:hypothetical protein
MQRYSIEDLSGRTEEVLKVLSIDEGIIVTGLDGNLVRSAYAETNSFFDSKLKFKYRLGDDPFLVPFAYNFSKLTIENESRDDFVFAGVEVDNEIVAELREKGLECEVDRWPTDNDFSNLRSAILGIYDQLQDVPVALGLGCGQNIFSAFRYYPTKNKMRIKEHTDDAYVLAVKPDKDPLEAYVNGRWFDEQIADDEALLIEPGVAHRVKNTEGYRNAIVMSILESPM